MPPERADNRPGEIPSSIGVSVGALGFAAALGAALFALISTGAVLPAWRHVPTAPASERAFLWCEEKDDGAVRALTAAELSRLAPGAQVAEVEKAKGVRMLKRGAFVPAAPPFRLSFLLHAPLPLNLADAPTLTLLPEIGPKRAVQIVQDRQQYGAFAGLDDFAGVPGIGQGRAERLEAWLDFRVPAK